MCFDSNFEFLRVVGGGSDCGSIVDPVGCVAGDLGCDVTIDHVAFDNVSCEAGSFTRDLTRNVVAFEIARRRLGDTAGDVAFDTPCRSTDNCACDVAFDIVLDTALSDFFLSANIEYKLLYDILMVAFLFTGQNMLFSCFLNKKHKNGRKSKKIEAKLSKNRVFTFGAQVL